MSLEHEYTISIEEAMSMALSVDWNFDNGSSQNLRACILYVIIVIIGTAGLLLITRFQNTN